MQNIEDYYILGLPIDTKIGKLHPVFMDEYMTLMEFMNILLLDKNDIVVSLKQIMQENEEIKDYIKTIIDYANTVPLFNFIVSFSDEKFKESFLSSMYYECKRLFEFCFKEDVFDKIQTDEEFGYYINLIKKVNNITHKKLNSNPEVARFEIIKRDLQEAKGESITFEAMYSSVLLKSGTHPNEMTVYQFNKVFDRIGHFKNYDTTTLFKTVDVSGKLKIHPWHGMTKESKLRELSQKQLDDAIALQKEGGLQSNL